MADADFETVTREELYSVHAERGIKWVKKV